MLYFLRYSPTFCIYGLTSITETLRVVGLGIELRLLSYGAGVLTIQTWHSVLLIYYVIFYQVLIFPCAVY